MNIITVMFGGTAQNLIISHN